MRKLIFAVMLIASQGVHAEFNDGVAAFFQGDYARAMQVMQPLAETADHAMAQYFMGGMYETGRGVDRDYEAAAKWYRSAAEKGIASAQLKLGGLYAKGNGVPKDLEFAYAWFSVAAHLGNNRAATLKDKTRDSLTPELLSAAEELSLEYITAYGNPPEDKRLEGKI